MTRTNQILSGILVAQLAIIAFLFWPGRGASAAVTKLYTGVTLDDIQSMTVSSTDKSITITRGGDGWVLPEAEDYPVQAVQASDTISKVLNIDTRRLVASNSTSHKRLEVADDNFVNKVELTTKDGKTLTLYVGSSPSFRSTNVRTGDSDNVYLTSSLASSDLHTDYGSWVNTTYVAIPTTDVQAVTVQNANATLDFTKVSTDTWTLADLAADETFNQNNLSSLLTRLTGLNMVKPLGKTAKPEYGMDALQATITVQSQPAGGQAKTTTLLIGAQLPESKNYVLKSSESDYYVEVASFSVENFVNRGRSDYLQAPPTPAAETPGATSAITETGILTDFNAITTTTPITATEVVTPAQ
ncbi:MAG: DUF4340 domain-containing protein [Caldilineaceae bacterium]